MEAECIGKTECILEAIQIEEDIRGAPSLLYLSIDFFVCPVLQK